MAPTRNSKGKGKLVKTPSTVVEKQNIAVRREKPAAGRASSSCKRGPAAVGEIYPTLWFKDAMFQTRFEEYRGRKVSPGRFLDISFLESISFPYLAQFREFGWMSLLEIKGEYSDMIVKHFYTNAEMMENVDGVADRISSYVKGVPIVVDAKLISDLYDVPLLGVAFGGTFNLLEACRVVYEDSELTVPRKDVASLGRDMRLLQLIVVHFLKQRSGRLSQLSREDIWMMWKIIEGRRINICDLIIYGISECVCRPSSRGMTYGCLITDMMGKLGVDLADEKMTRLHPNSEIGENSLIKADFELVDGVWTKSKKTFGFASYIPPTPAAWEDFMVDFWCFQTDVRDQLQELLSRQSHLESEVRALKDLVDESSDEDKEVS